MYAILNVHSLQFIKDFITNYQFGNVFPTENKNNDQRTVTQFLMATFAM